MVTPGSEYRPRSRHYGVEGGQIGPPERAHGEFEMEHLYSDELVKLSQIRGTKNKISAELKESIRHSGLMNSIDAARVSPELLQEYIDFTNEVWGSDALIDDFADNLHPDGLYRLVVAGHSRHEAITELEVEAREGLSSLRPVALLTKIHEVDSVEDIVRLQRDENTHSVPAQERVAMAEVETYLWGVKKGRWSTTDEYIGAHKGATKRKMENGLAFHAMPKQARDFIHTSALPFLVGVEIGKTVNVLRDYEAVCSGFEGAKDSRLAPGTEGGEQLAELVKEQVIQRCTLLVNKRLNSTAGKAHVEAWRSRMRKKLATHREEEKEKEVLELELIDPLENLKNARKEVKRQVRILLAQMKSKPTENFVEAIRLNAHVVGDDEIHAALVDMEGILRKSLHGMGTAALREVTHADHEEAQLGLAV